MTRTTGHTRSALLAHIRELESKQQEADETLAAIRNGLVDALVVAGPRGDRVFAIQAADHSFRVLVEGMSEGALTLAADGTILYSNPRFARMIGLPLEKVGGSRLADYVSAADQPLLDALLQEGLTGSSDGGLDLQTAAGRAVPVYFASSRMRTEANDAVALCVVITDLTQQVRNQAIVASERLAHSMLEQAGEVIVVCDPEEMVVRASRQAFIVCAGNPLRRPFASAFPLWLEAPAGQPYRHGPEQLLSLAAVADGQHVLAVKGRLQCEDHAVPVLASAVPLRGDSGELLGFVVTMTDVSQLEAAIKELEAFSYSVAHDLRSPLRAIDGFSRILLDEYASEVGEEARGYLQLVSDNAREMGQLVDGLLAFSRLGRQPLRTEWLLPNDLIRQVLADLAPEQAGRHLEISVGDLSSCDADPILLKQVFVNLISNALKFTSQRAIGHITVGCRQVNGEVVYFVADDGAGFDMKYAHKLFGVFQRLHRVEDYPGTGVGLAIVQRIVHRHGGRIWADAALDHGATFSFTLPGAQAATPGWSRVTPLASLYRRAAQGRSIVDGELMQTFPSEQTSGIAENGAPSPSTAPPDPKPLRVLMVEDRPADAMLLAHLLTQAGFVPEWTRVETESEFLAQLDPMPDIVLADYTLPQFSGLEALRLLRERGVEIPFILITGVAGEEAAVSALHLGADDYLLKDRLARLGPAVTRALEQYTLREAKRRSEWELFNQERNGRAEAEAAVRVRDEFVAIASHELRTPVTVIKATAQVLARFLNAGTLKPAMALDRLQTINLMSDRLAVLIADLLDVSRLRTGRLQLQPVHLDLADLAQQVLTEQRVRLGVEYPLNLRVLGMLPSVSADPFRLHQVLSNLVENAVKYSPAGGEVEIRLREQESGISLTVSDHGIGLPPDATHSIFEPFGRARNAQQRQLPGMGLGLYIARQIVEQHGGRIGAASPGEGLGTEVTVWLPGAGADAVGPRPMRILVVDDEAAIRSTLHDIFEVLGYECREAADGREALSILAGWGADLIVLDLMMPVMDGWAFRHEQQDVPTVRDIPVVVISARKLRDDARDAELVPTAVVAKPFELDDLVKTVHHVLSASSQIDRAS